jgi:hypothetical protein
MNSKQTLAAAFFLASAIVPTLGPAIAPAQAQLPPTRMGKFVHQPGDIQYSLKEQVKRHSDSGFIDTGGAGSVIIRRPRALPASHRPAAFGVGYGQELDSSYRRSFVEPTPVRPNIELEPIVADEPVAPAGFPPLPNTLDLPINNNPTVLEKKTTEIQTKKTGYYKVGTPAPIQRSVQSNGETFSSGSGKAPQYLGKTGKDLSKLGKEPKLLDEGELGSPEAPGALMLSSPVTQDLSLPDSPSASKTKQNSVSRKVKNAGRSILRGAPATGRSLLRRL